MAPREPKGICDAKGFWVATQVMLPTYDCWSSHHTDPTKARQPDGSHCLPPPNLHASVAIFWKARSPSTVPHHVVMPGENLSICRLNHPLQASPVHILPLSPHARASVWRRAGRRDEQRRRNPSHRWRGRR
ncbi:unnamed protein product [Ectocarpus sp. 12 AP-2014]